MFNFIANIDLSIEKYLNSLSQPAFLKLFYFITQFGNVFVAAIVFLAVVWFVWPRNRRSLKYLTYAIVLNEVLVYVIKHIVGRLRPLGALIYKEYDASFPSGHAAISILLYGYICYLIVKFYPRSWQRDLGISFLSILILLVGFSRLYLDVHYFSDVLAGYLLGGTILWYLVKKA